MRIWNLTPHPMHYDDGIRQRVFSSDGVLRLQQFDEAADPVDGLVTVRTRYKGIVGLPPEVARGDVLLVSTVAADAWQPED